MKAEGWFILGLSVMVAVLFAQHLDIKEDLAQAENSVVLLTLQKHRWESEKRNLSESLGRMGIELVFAEKGYTLTKHFK